MAFTMMPTKSVRKERVNNMTRDPKTLEAVETFLKLSPTQRAEVIALCSSLASQQESPAVAPLSETHTS
jgi:hypothetical protein